MPPVRIWSVLFVPPLVFLVMITAEYAMVPWACENQHRLPLHVVAAISLAIVLGFLGLAWRNWRATGVEPPDDSPEPQVRLRFFSVLGLMMTTIVAVATAALWLAQFVLSPCLR